MIDGYRPIVLMPPRRVTALPDEEVVKDWDFVWNREKSTYSDLDRKLAERDRRRAENDARMKELKAEIRALKKLAWNNLHHKNPNRRRRGKGLARATVK